MQIVVTETEERRYAELQMLSLDYARQGETDSLAAMIRHGLPVNLADAKGNTLLMLASYHGNADTARMLLEAGAEVDCRNDRGQTPLGGVAFKGNEEMVALLLEQGADVDADNGGGMTPIMYASMFGRVKVVEQLRAHGASLQRRNRLGISARFMVKLSPLDWQAISKTLIVTPGMSMKFNESFPSLITPDPKSGLALASELAEELQAQIVHASSELQSPGGTSYTDPPPVPKEIISSILFYSIAAANHGWSRPGGEEGELENSGADRLGPGFREVS